jgi:hypothetical protein
MSKHNICFFTIHFFLLSPKTPAKLNHTLTHSLTHTIKSLTPLTCTVSRNLPMSEPHPDLDAIKPGVKIAVNEEESRKFDVLSTSHNCPVTLETRDDGRVSYVRHAMSKEECENLCKVMDNSDHLSFWNDQGRGNEKARQFRDADTIEVNLPSLASTLWSRIYDVFDKTPIVIRHDDTEHVSIELKHVLYICQ